MRGRQEERELERPGEELGKAREEREERGRERERAVVG